MLLVPEEEAEEYDIFETLQAQTERIEMLEKQNAALVRHEEYIFELLELSKKTENEIVERLWQLTNILADNICGRRNSEQESKEFKESHESNADAPNSPDPGQVNSENN